MGDAVPSPAHASAGATGGIILESETAGLIVPATTN
jgi:hypothetical protein